jgi:hypothetical protein
MKFVFDILDLFLLKIPGYRFAAKYDRDNRRLNIKTVIRCLVSNIAFSLRAEKILKNHRCLCDCHPSRYSRIKPLMICKRPPNEFEIVCLSIVSHCEKPEFCQFLIFWWRYWWSNWKLLHKYTIIRRADQLPSDKLIGNKIWKKSSILISNEHN